MIPKGKDGDTQRASWKCLILRETHISSPFLQQTTPGKRKTIIFNWFSNFMEKENRKRVKYTRFIPPGGVSMGNFHLEKTQSSTFGPLPTHPGWRRWPWSSPQSGEQHLQSSHWPCNTKRWMEPAPRTLPAPQNCSQTAKTPNIPSPSLSSLGLNT